MADLSLGDYGSFQMPNALDQASKLAQVHKDSLDVAKEARDFNALKQYGAGAAAGDPQATEALASQSPVTAGQFANWMKTRTETDQAKDNLIKGHVAQIAQMASQVSDPEQQKAIFHKGIDIALEQGLMPRAKADYFRGIVDASQAEGLNAFIHGNLQAAQTPLVAGQSAAATGRTQAELDRLQRTGQAPHVWWEQETGPDGKPLTNPDGTPKLVRKQFNPAEQPGTSPPGGGFGGTPWAPTIVPGGTPTPPASTRPRSDATGAPRFTPASYTTSSAAERDVGDAGEYGQGSPTLPQSAYKARLFGQESGNKDVPNRMGSSASGVGQFIDSTWKAQMQKLIPDQIAGMNDRQIMALKSDSNLQHAATMSLADDNASTLAKSGIPVNAATLAMSHKIGAGGVIKAFSSDPNSSMAAVLRSGEGGEQAVQKNPSWARQSVRGFVNSHYNAFGSKPVAGIGGALPTGVAAGATVPAPSAAMVPPTERSGPTAATAPVSHIQAYRDAYPPRPGEAAPGAATALGAPAATPAAAEPAPASPAASWTPGRPNTGSFTYGGGDSIGLGFIKAAGVPGTTAASTTVKGSEGADGVGSRNPQQALDFITAHPDRFEGQDVIWSTGLSNSGGAKKAEENLALVEKQIAEMQKAKANNIVIAGVGEGSQYGHLNDRLDAIARDNGVSFAGALPTSGIHLPNEKAYKDYVQNATRLLEQKRSEAEPTGPPDELIPSEGGLPRSALQTVADTSGALPPPDELITPAAPRASTQPVGETLAASKGYPMPSEADLERQKQEALQPGKLYEHGVEAAQTAKATSDQKIMDESRAQAQESEISMQQLHQISNMLDQTTTGPLAPTRQKLMSAFAEFAKLAGLPETDAGREAARLALITTAGSELAFAMVKALGSREAQQVVQQVMNIKPNIMLSNEENEMIVASLRQGFQRSIDRHDFIMQNKAKMGIDGAEHQFNKVHPVETYSSKVVPFPIKAGMTDEDYQKNVIYNMSGHGKDAPFKFGKWDGDSFDKVDERTIPGFNKEKTR